MHPLQDAVVEGLRAQRHAVDAGAPPGRRVFERHVFGVGFDRDFDGVTQRRSTEGVEQRREQSRDRLGRQEGRSAAAEVEGFQTLTTEIPGLAPGVSRTDDRQLPEDSVHVLPRRDALAHRDGEIAVGAAALAEGHVEVEVAHGENLTRNAERGTRNRQVSPAAASDHPVLFRVPRSNFRVQASPNTIPGRCVTTPRISSSVNAVSTAPVSAPAVATSTSTCRGSVRSVSHNERCRALRSGGGVRADASPSAAPGTARGSPSSSRMSPAASAGFAPCWMSLLHPSDVGLVIGPGTARTARPWSSAQSAVISAPDPGAASITTVTPASPEMRRLRLGKAPAWGRSPGGSSVTRQPRATMRSYSTRFTAG